MSKICDVKNMYGQDFNIVTTNAPSNIIKNSSEELLSVEGNIGIFSSYYKHSDNNIYPI